MEKSQWDEAGGQIRELVDDAVKENDYRKLNEQVNEVIANVLDNGNDALKSVISSALGAGSPENNKPSGRASSGAAKDDSALYTVNLPKRGNKISDVLLPNQYFASVNGDRIKSYIKGFFGALFELNAAGVLAGYAIRAHSFLGGRISGFGLGLTLVFAGLGAWLIWQGVDGTKRCTRFAAYRRRIGDKAYIALKDLAEAVGKPLQFVKEDVRRMIRDGWFKEGHLDEDETTVLVSHEIYEQYQAHYDELMAMKREAKAREQAEKKEKAERAKKEKVSKEVQELLDRGEEFLAGIRACNERISGEEMTKKISRMEILVDRIFDRAGEHPEVIPELKRLMSYYLPTTVKLLQAYAELEEEPVQGENIRTSKKEIEDTIDTLNIAFEKLLDSIFQDTAWDISSDITVLQQMLAGEGLLDDGLTAMKV